MCPHHYPAVAGSRRSPPSPPSSSASPPLLSSWKEATSVGSTYQRMFFTIQEREYQRSVEGESMGEDIGKVEYGGHVVSGAAGTLRTRHIKLLVCDESDVMLTRGFTDQVDVVYRNLPSHLQEDWKFDVVCDLYDALTITQVVILSNTKR